VRWTSSPRDPMSKWDEQSICGPACGTCLPTAWFAGRLLQWAQTEVGARSGTASRAAGGLRRQGRVGGGQLSSWRTDASPRRGPCAARRHSCPGWPAGVGGPCLVDELLAGLELPIEPPLFLAGHAVPRALRYRRQEKPGSARGSVISCDDAGSTDLPVGLSWLVLPAASHFDPSTVRDLVVTTSVDLAGINDI
jgi:hypothetical protein